MVLFAASAGLALAFIVFISDFWSEGKLVKLAHFERIVSLTAGISITYIFLDLFPNLFRSSILFTSRILFVFVLLGFVLYHFFVKFTYLHSKANLRKKKIQFAHAWSLFTYHFVVGILLVTFAEADFFSSVLFFFPIWLHTVVDALPRATFFSKTSVKLFFTSGSFLGAVLAFFVPIPEFVRFALLGVVTGMLIFLETRELIPRKRSGNPWFFLLGVIIYGGVISYSWQFLA